MDKVQKPSNSECYTPSSEPFRIYLYRLQCIGIGRNSKRKGNLMNKFINVTALLPCWITTTSSTAVAAVTVTTTYILKVLVL
jgi:hypothetical protein